MKTEFRAILLAAGLGSRLRPLTLETPKCLVKVKGEPILGRWLRQLESAGCQEVLINTHYLSDQVNDFIESWKVKNMKIHLSYEKTLLGTAGTLFKHSGFFGDKTGALIHADNAMSGRLRDLIETHNKRCVNCELTMLTFTSSCPQNCGIVQTDAKGIVTSFEEKPKNPKSNIANGAVYIFSPEFLSSAKEIKHKTIDFSVDVLPKFINRIQTWHTDEPYFDIGTHDSLELAEKYTLPVT